MLWMRLAPWIDFALRRAAASWHRTGPDRLIAIDNIKESSKQCFWNDSSYKSFVDSNRNEKSPRKRHQVMVEMVSTRSYAVSRVQVRRIDYNYYVVYEPLCLIIVAQTQKPPRIDTS